MAMILSNAAGEGEKPVKTLESITTLGNTLTEKGFCVRVFPRVVMLSRVLTGFSPSPAALLKIIAN